MEDVRLKYSKTGAVKYVSHLDIMRCFARAFSRAKIPIWYTEGYNPHAYMNFSPPLPLGVESACEFVDVRLTAEMPFAEIQERLNETLPQGFQIMGVYADFQPQSAIAFSDYAFEVQFLNPHAAAEQLSAVLEREEILAEKTKKKGKKHIVTQINLKEKIVSSEVAVCQNTVCLTARLQAGGQGNLNPVLLFETVTKLMDAAYTFQNIKRLALLDSEYKEFQ